MIQFDRAFPHVQLPILPPPLISRGLQRGPISSVSAPEVLLLLFERAVLRPYLFPPHESWCLCIRCR